MLLLRDVCYQLAGKEDGERESASCESVLVLKESEEPPGGGSPRMSDDFIIATASWAWQTHDFFSKQSLAWLAALEQQIAKQRNQG
jgi:hypothetical protein